MCFVAQHQDQEGYKVECLAHAYNIPHPILEEANSHGAATLDGSPFVSGSTVSAVGAHTLIVTTALGNTTTMHFIINHYSLIVS